MSPRALLECRTIAEDFEEKEPLIIGTLNGAFVFMAGDNQEMQDL